MKARMLDVRAQLCVNGLHRAKKSGASTCSPDRAKESYIYIYIYRGVRRGGGAGGLAPPPPLHPNLHRQAYTKAVKIELSTKQTLLGPKH